MQTMQAEGLTSTYGEKTLFDNVSFTINENDRIGLIAVSYTHLTLPTKA